MPNKIKYYYNKRENDLFAVIPFEEKPNFMTCYSHVGQHSLAHMDYIRESRLATKKESANLRLEVESIYREILC